MRRPRTAASADLSGSESPSLWPIASTTTVPHTVATITTPSLTLIEPQAVERSHGSSA